MNSNVCVKMDIKTFSEDFVLHTKQSYGFKMKSSGLYCYDTCMGFCVLFQAWKSRDITLFAWKEVFKNCSCVENISESHSGLELHYLVELFLSNSIVKRKADM